MGGAQGEKGHRSSSPLKRPASELEEDTTIITNGDVEMVNGPEASTNGISAKRSNNTPPPASIANMGMKNDTKTADDMDTDGEEDVDFFADAAPAAALPADSDVKIEAQNIDSKKVNTPAPQKAAAPDVDAPPPPPSIDEQIRIVTELISKFNSLELKAGTRTYVISNRWVDRVKAHGSGAKVSAEVAESDIGPVDNSDIIWEVLIDQNNQPWVRLNPSVDFLPGGEATFLPQEAWDLVVSWYGLKDGQSPIIRTAVDTSETGQDNVQFETHPCVYRVHRLWAATSPIPIDQLTKAQKPPPKTWIASREDKMQAFLQHIKQRTGVKSDCKVKLWTVPEVVPRPAAGSATPSRASSPAPEEIDWSQMLIEANAFNTLKTPGQKESSDYKEPASGGSNRTIAMTGLGKDTRIVLDEIVEGHSPLSTFVKKLKSGGKTSALATTVKGASSALTTTTDSGRSSPAPAPVIRTTRGRRSDKTVGCVGLQNLGNTCYMNSALQCIRSVEELTKYFLSNEAEKELNTENPLGKGGQVAMVYNGLLREMYKVPAPNSVTPRQFKNIIGRFFPNFSGYGQQDSQEFLGLLLDALQEDLNRIKKKPYIEKPDSTDEMVNDPEALKKMADEVWSITKRRDDSVISDLFTGMYKSTLVCPACEKVSITFDPFNTVTVQIPIENTWSHTVQYFPLNGKPFMIDVDMDKNGSIKTMKEFISSRVGVPPKRMFVGEEWKSMFYKNFRDTMQVSEEIAQNDHILVFELDMTPTNWPPVRKQKQKIRSMLLVDGEEEKPVWETEEAEKLLVPVVFRRKPSKTFNRKLWESTMMPQMICLTKDEARSEEIIRKKILQRVQNLTTWTIPADNEFTSDSEADKDIHITTASDASSGDSKVAARSVEGEDDLVDVTMKDTNASSKPEDFEGRGLPCMTRPPKWLSPEVPLQKAYENIFDITYYHDRQNDVLPAGLNVINDDTNYPSIRTRIRRRAEPVEKLVPEPDVAAEQDATTPVSEEDEDVAQLGESVTRMNDESSDEDDDLAAKKQKILPVRPAKSLNPLHKSPFFGGDGSGDSPSDEEEVVQEPLVRLGEGLIVDWNEQAVLALMDGGQDQGSYQGDPKYCPTLEDAELDKKRQHRSTRRRNGVSLSECLDEFGKEEVLSEMDTWYCPRCKEHRRASKKLELWKTPDILILHFKRFSSTSHRRDKLDVTVDFPIEGLDMTKRIVESDGKEEVYDLFAVDNHYGSLGGGHYTACAKSFVDGEWYDYNDSSVSKIKDPTRVITNAAYLLFYRRRSKTALGGPKFQKIIEELRAQEEEVSEGDEEDEQGNGQRLGVDSPSRNGSSSALVGVGATVPIQGFQGAPATVTRRGLLSPSTSPTGPGVGSVGLGAGRTLGAMGRNNIPSSLSFLNNSSGTKLSAQHIENLPDYQSALNDGAETAPPNYRDAALNDGIEMNDLNSDSGLGEDMGMSEAFGGGFDPAGNWTFAGLKTRSMASDVVANGSDASDDSVRGRLEDFDNASVDEDYREPTPPPFLDESGAAGSVQLQDLSEDVYQAKIARVARGTPRGIGANEDALPEGINPADMWEDDLELEIPMAPAEDDEPEAMEIHVEEGEGLGVSPKKK